MGIYLKTRVRVWGRAGGRCSFEGCGEELFEDPTETDDESLIGDIAHIVAESSNGPRGESPLTVDQRDRYANLILLCKKHHKIADDQVNRYTVDVLHGMKAKHEAKVRSAWSATELDEQRDRELYAGYIDHWQDAAQLELWQSWTSDLMQARPSLDPDLPAKFDRLGEWILSRIWPGRFLKLEASLANFAVVLGDLMGILLKYSELNKDRDRLWMRPFYRDTYDDSYSERDRVLSVAKYEYLTDLIADLTLEVTRAANYICDQVRSFVNADYRLQEGVLLVPAATDTSLHRRTFRPEYLADERVLRPYPGLAEFEHSVRATRDSNYGPRDDDRANIPLEELRYCRR